jgi:hypothetical protein
MTDRLAASLHARWLVATRPDRQRGSVSIEAVLFAVALIAVAGIVIAALTGFVQREAAKIN